MCGGCTAGRPSGSSRRSDGAQVGTWAGFDSGVDGHPAYLPPLTAELGLDHYDYHWASSHEGEEEPSSPCRTRRASAPLGPSCDRAHYPDHSSSCAASACAHLPPPAPTRPRPLSPPAGVQAIAPGNSSDVAAAGGANATLSAALGMEAAAGWAPFNHKRDGKALLGQLDLAFLGAYACGCRAGCCAGVNGLWCGMPPPSWQLHLRLAGALRLCCVRGWLLPARRAIAPSAR